MFPPVFQEGFLLFSNNSERLFHINKLHPIVAFNSGPSIRISQFDQNCFRLLDNMDVRRFVVIDKDSKLKSCLVMDCRQSFLPT